MRLLNMFSTSKLYHNWKQKIKQSSLEGHWQEVLENYIDLNKAGLHLEDPTLFPHIFKACANLHYLREGISLHACIIRQGLESFTSIGNSTIDFYIKCGVMSSAMRVFAYMENKDSVSWNIFINGCFKFNQGSSKEGLLMFVQARAAGFEPNVSTLVLVLQACRDFRAICEGFSIHGFLIRSGFLSDVSVQNSLLSFYSEFEEMEIAEKLFDEMLVRDVISWSVMIGEYVRSGDSLGALLLFQEMLSSNEVKPDEFTVVSILKACTSLMDICLGRLVHCFVISKGFDSDTFVGNSLVDMYSKCIDSDSALQVFNEMSRRNIVSWNSILSGLVHNVRFIEALALFFLMGEAGLDADAVTMVTLLQICKNLRDPSQCKSIHSRVIRWGFESNELVRNAVIDAYAKCDLIEFAWELFQRMESRDTICWSTMISALSHSDKPVAAIGLFQEMILKGKKFNSVTMLSVLEACSLTAHLRRSKWAHGVAIRHGMTSEVAIGTALLDMYSKCGAVDSSRKVFDQMSDRNVVSWSAMIAAYGTSGRVYDALSLLSEMELSGLKPNAVTMISILSACSHGGLIEEGHSCLQRMMHDHGFQPSMEHYSCIVDMLSRAGNLDSAMDVIKSMPAGINAGASVWGALLSACRNSGNSELGGRAASCVLKLEPSNSAGYVLASSMYAASRMWEDAARMRKMVKNKGVKVVAGYSLVHIDDKAYKFVAEDGFYHLHSEEIHGVVEQLHCNMKIDEIQELFIPLSL
ncbi:Pentatricopeptide repeat [Thalictrum thalictroides]|uniref:Pentatricopeptide repeat n=1 Tax=Thalictrum thalictroides TaxID=46969 RepID=A0A7J6X611_THATH|nr:Pentatricopeptide repeat [Thalictrum thalictroides]